MLDELETYWSALSFRRTVDRTAVDGIEVKPLGLSDRRLTYLWTPPYITNMLTGERMEEYGVADRPMEPEPSREDRPDAPTYPLHLP